MRAMILTLALLTATAASAGERPRPYFESTEVFIGRHLYGYGPAYTRNDDWANCRRPRVSRARR